MPFAKLNKPTIALSFILLTAYIFLLYATPREQFGQLLFLYVLLFLSYTVVANPFGKSNLFLAQNYKYWIAFGVLLRVVALGVVPPFSDDFYRFYWDGLLVSHQVSPFAYLPSKIIEGGALPFSIESLNEGLFNKLNSPNYYSIYPPVCQVVFGMGAAFFPKNIIGAVFFFKLAMLAFELGTLFFMLRLLKYFALASSLALVYWLNPLVLVELVGNIHFEAAMICFMLGAIYFLTQSPFFKADKSIFGVKIPLYFDKNMAFSAIFLALAICSKLLPLVFLPFLFKRLGFLNTIFYSLAVFVVVAVLFFPFLNFALLQNLGNSVHLYFGKFEFNASLYYVARWVGYQVSGYNQIAVIGAFFSKIVLVLILFKALLEKGAGSLLLLPQQWLWALTIYLVFATVVHPWYIAPLIAFAPFVHLRFAVVWSALVMLSYAAYITSSYTENLSLVFLEYVVVFVFGGIEIFRQKKVFY